MSARKFHKLSFFFKNEKAWVNKCHKGNKIRPLVIYIQNLIIMIGVFEQILLAYEIIVKYYGRNVLKHLIRSKSTIFDYKPKTSYVVSGYM